MNHVLQAVLFDMDGLMFDTERLVARCWAKIREETGFDISDTLLSQARGLTGPEYRACFERVLGEKFDYPSASKRKWELFWSYVAENGFPVKPGLVELLRFLKKEGILVVMATATRQDIAADFVARAGVGDFFDGYVFGDQVTKGKPDPEIFLAAAEKLHVKPYECIALEDSINGVKAGIRGGFHTIMVPDLEQPSPELQTQLLYQCSSLLEVIPFLEAKKAGGKRQILV